MPSRCPDAWAVVWRAAATPTGRRQVMSWREQRLLSRLPDAVTIHRGCAPGGERGWSWTAAREVALDFAARHEGATALLCTATVEKAVVVALLRSGGELEIIVDPSSLDWRAVRIERV